MSVTILPSDPDLVNALSGLVGALVGALATFLGVLAQQRFAERQRREDERARVDGFLKAIEVEITVLFDRYEKTMASTVRGTPPGQPIRSIFPTPGEYLVVYQSNAGLIGSIDDDDLRAAIVRAYTLARATLETFVLNSALSIHLDALERQQIGEGSVALAALVQDTTEEMAAYATSMKDADAELTLEVSTLKRLLSERRR